MVQQGRFCSKKSIGYKKISLYRAEKSMLLHAVCLQCPTQTYRCLLTFCIQKNVMLAMLLLLLTTWWPRSQGSCGWAFWGLLHSMRLATVFEMYIWASVLILTSHQNFKVATMVQLGDNVATLQKLSLCVKHDCYAGDVHHPAYCGSGIALSTMLLCITENQSG